MRRELLVAALLFCAATVFDSRGAAVIPETPAESMVSRADVSSGFREQSAQSDPTSCEEGIRAIDGALYETLEAKTPLIAIVRAGTGEKEKLQRRRADVIAGFCEGRTADASRCITAIGKQRRGSGSAELYANGVLFATIYYKKSTASFCDRP